MSGCRGLLRDRAGGGRLVAIQDRFAGLDDGSHVTSLLDIRPNRLVRSMRAVANVLKKPFVPIDGPNVRKETGRTV